MHLYKKSKPSITVYPHVAFRTLLWMDVDLPNRQVPNHMENHGLIHISLIASKRRPKVAYLWD